MSSDDHTEQLLMARERLHVLEAIVDALDRRGEVSAAITAAGDFPAASKVLRTLLDTDDAGASAVLTLHWSAFTAMRSRQAHDDLAEMREIVAALQDP